MTKGHKIKAIGKNDETINCQTIAIVFNEQKSFHLYFLSAWCTCTNLSQERLSLSRGFVMQYLLFLWLHECGQYTIDVSSIQFVRVESASIFHVLLLNDTS